MANKWEDLEVTKAELENIEQALKNKEFRKLLVEYCEELTDPASRKKYQEEITQLEKERGIDVTFIDPKPGYVIKTSLEGSKLAFINVCTNDIVEKPTSKPTTKDGAIGTDWSVPHFISPPREDLNKKGKRCTVYDVIFNPETLILSTRNKNFRQLINDTACDAIESNHGVKLDKTNLKFPKLQFKGMARPLVIRKKFGATNKLDLEDPVDKIYSDIYQQIDENTSVNKAKNVDVKITPKSQYATPTYLIKHRTNLDLQDFTFDVNAHQNDAIPKDLIIEVNLPLLKSSSELQLDVTEKTLSVLSEKPSKYKLFLTLPYTVFEESGSAKFDQDLRKLIVTLPVKRRSLNFENSLDSGVDSDNSPVMSDLSLPLIEELNIEDSDNKNSACDISECAKRKLFLEPELHYSLPEYSCHLFNSILIFTLHVKNVDSISLEKVFLNDNSAVHIKFSSLSPAFVPINYAFYIQISPYFIDVPNFSTEIWDNNIVVQIPYLPNETQLESYVVGVSNENTEEKVVDEPTAIFKHLNKQYMCSSEDIESDDGIHFEVKSNENGDRVEIIINPQPNNQNEEKVESEPKTSDEENGNSKKLAHSYSESSCDEFSVSPTKGILKPRSRTLSRSVSESSVDDYTWSSFENFSSVSDTQIPEDIEVSSSMKKTVRFNDVVSKQLFRTNSSILGQKKKNQRKSRNKKRAQERRLSESENSESEDKREKFKKQPENMQTLNTDNIQNKNDYKNDLIFDIDM